MENNTYTSLDALYQEHVMDHFRNPRNTSALAQPTCAMHGANPTCGDRLSLSLAFADDRVSQVAANAVGCAISVASASMLSEQMIGKTREELAAITEETVRELLGVPISPNRLRCAMLPLATLKDALTHPQS